MQLNYQHYSFDLWETLLKSNPLFRQERVEFFRKSLNPLMFKTEFIDGAISEVSKQCDTVNQAVGGCIDALEMYAMVLYKLGHNISEWNRDKMQVLYADIEKIFLQHPPKIYSEETNICLRTLTRNSKSFSVLSNTGFVKGKTIKKVLKDTFIDNASALFFSDEISASKPSAMAFSHLVFHTTNGSVPADHVIHIGDNIVADYEDAKHFGVAAAIINSNGKTISEVL